MLSIKPVCERLIVKPISEPFNKLHIPMRQQCWRGVVVRNGEDVRDLFIGDFIRFQPMKRRHDLFSWNGEEFISLDRSWVYCVEMLDGTPIQTFGNRFVLKMIENKMEMQDGLLRPMMYAHDDFHSAEVVCSGGFPQLSIGERVLVKKSEFWQFYRVKGEWLFISHADNLLAAYEKDYL